MDIKIQDLKDVKIKGVEVVFTETVKDIEKLDHFEWTLWPLVTTFASTNNVTVGLLQGWHHTPNYDTLEYHNDTEIFYFSEGTAIMFFVDLRDDDSPIMETMQMVRIPAGTLINVSARKGHWVPVAEDDRYTSIVIAPPQGDIRVPLPEVVRGV